MRYYAYVSNSCREDASRHGLVKEVEKLSQKVERDQSIATWDNFLPTPYVKKSLATWRVIAEKRVPKESESIVICFLSLLSRGDSEYNNFLNDPKAFCQRLSPNDEELKEILRHRIPDPPPPLPELNEIEYNYLFHNIPKSDISDGIVYESFDWVERITKSSTSAEWCYDLLNEIFILQNPEKTCLQKHNLRMLYRIFPDQKRIFLIAPINENFDKDEAVLLQKYEKILTSSQIIDEQLLRASGRAYPAYIVADSSIWLSMQKNREANLALSPEESDILDSVLHPDQNADKIYPLFINGRPGSGKSTILHYLFAEQIYLHLSKKPQERIQYPPLYLTYSEKLLKLAKSSIKSIVLCNAKIVVNETNFSFSEMDNVFESCFGEFHRFLTALLPAKDRESFETSKRIDFPEFRNLWYVKMRHDPDAELRKLSPELVWHVIRIYIKGMKDDANNYFDPDAYKELPTKQRTVEQKTFERIYQKVWERWYKKHCEVAGVWDNQDLTRVILNNGEDINLSKYPVVFCDEAQDFTKNELELIFRLSLFSRRIVPPSMLRRVPFAFAGDPFQTLNPTGFNWSSVQAGFYEKIVQELDKTANAKLEFNYKELSFNYRSTRNIVCLCNVIQLLRGILFDIRDLRPQRTWFEEDSPMPVFFDVEDSICKNKLQEQTELVIILPCQEGEESEFIKNDPFLSTLSQNDIRNFLSPMSAKGLEFSRVVLYKFGDDSCKNYPKLLEPLRTGIPHNQNPETALPLEYFMNRLYVAASRAKRRLFIVDTGQGIETFWNSKILRNPEDLLTMYAAAVNNEWSSDDLTYNQPGREESWSEDRDDPVRLAEQFSEEGIASRNPYKLLLAEANYKRVAGKTAKALKCKAMRLELEDSYQEAGSVYRELSDDENALRCFWKARSYAEILGDQRFADTLEQRASDFLLTSRSAANCNAFAEFLHKEIQGPRRIKILLDSQWCEICQVLITSAAGFDSKSINWQRLYHLLGDLSSFGLKFEKSASFAQIAFYAGKFEEAVNIWDALASPPTKSLDYQQARAFSTPYPENIKWLAQLQKFDEIIKEYETNGNASISIEHCVYVSEAYIVKQRHEDSLRLLKQKPNLQGLQRLFGEVSKRNLSNLIVPTASELIRAKLKIPEWRDTIQFIEEGKFNEEATKHLQSVLAYELAISDKLVSEYSDKTKDFVAKYLKKLFLSTNWENLVSVKVAGAAIERANKIVDALEFYEAIWKKRKIGTPQDEDFAKKRWLKCKYRQAEWSKENSKRKEDAMKQRDEADKFRKAWNFNIEEITEFPEIETEDYPLFTKQESEIRSTLSQKQRKAIIDLSNTGWSIQDIANTLNVSIQDVQDVLK